jgi:hypothetical protein
MKLHEQIDVVEDGNEFIDEYKTFCLWGDLPMEK